MNRRDFLRRAGVAAATAGGAGGQARSVSIVADPGDPIASAAPSRWAAKELQDALGARGVSVRVQRGDLQIVAAGAPARPAREILKSTRCSNWQTA